MSRPEGDFAWFAIHLVSPFIEHAPIALIIYGIYTVNQLMCLNC